jgi:transposase InsO family protein
VIELLESQSGKRTRTVRTDNGGEYINHELGDYFKKKGISHQTTVRYTPEQNGAAERLNRTIMERVRAMLEDSQLPPTLWAEAAVTANYIRLRSPAAGNNRTP